MARIRFNITIRYMKRCRNCIKCIGLLLAIAFNSPSVRAQAILPESTSCPSVRPPVRPPVVENKWLITFSSGYQQQNLHWSIAGNSNGQNPNVYSELKWRHVNGPSAIISVQWHAWKWLSVCADVSHTFILSGKADDTDYQGDNRTNRVYQGKFDGDKGYLASWSAGIGYRILHARLFHLTPFIGYGINYQSLFLVDHSGAFGKLNSNYSTNWHGPLVKIITALQVSHTIVLTADLVYHQVSYSAKADWNLISQFSHPVSFRQVADGYGLNADAGLVFSLGQHITFSMGAGYTNWQTGKGTDRLYLVSGQTNATRLNEAVTDGFRCVAGIGIFL
jgi:hypothetical protein